MGDLILRIDGLFLLVSEMEIELPANCLVALVKEWQIVVADIFSVHRIIENIIVFGSD